MPIEKNGAKLWFNSQEEEDEYDDKMIANIELKSTDFDDENFSPVFTRQTKEFFLEPSEKFKSDFLKMMAPTKKYTLEEQLNKYFLQKPNHTYYRSFTIDKFLAGFGIGYILLRDLPLRNFYARCLVIFAFAAKFLDHMKTPTPQYGAKGSVVMAPDRWAHWDVRCYDNVWRAVKFIEIPTVMNKIRESKIWSNKQPAHLLRSDMIFLPHFFGIPSRKTKEVQWDGTTNMPIFRLADPKHKDSYMIQFQ